MQTTLTPALLLNAYAQGVFPMGQPDSPDIEWYSPNPRGIIPLDDRFHVPKRLARTWRNGEYRVTYDGAFTQVMRACAQPRPNQPSTWISEEFVAVYTELHRLGHAHSVETWHGEHLVGGLYGVSIGGLFAGESMFSVARDASKIALIALVEHLRRGRFVILDTQWVTEHLAQFGAYWMPRHIYLQQLQHALRAPSVWPTTSADV